MGKIYDVVAVTGKYTNANGEEKKRYLNVGDMIEGEYGPFLAVDPHLSLAGLPRNGDRVILNLFTPKQKDQQQAHQASNQGQNTAQNQTHPYRQQANQVQNQSYGQQKQYISHGPRDNEIPGF